MKTKIRAYISPWVFNELDAQIKSKIEVCLFGMHNVCCVIEAKELDVDGKNNVFIWTPIEKTWINLEFPPPIDKQGLIYLNRSMNAEWWKWQNENYIPAAKKSAEILKRFIEKYK
jgi:hypothetical protein